MGERTQWPDGHTVHMTLDGEDSVATCDCGWRNIAARSAYERQDAAIELHWQAVQRNAAPIFGEVYGKSPCQQPVEDLLAHLREEKVSRETKKSPERNIRSHTDAGKSKA